MHRALGSILIAIQLAACGDSTGPTTTRPLDLRTGHGTLLSAADELVDGRPMFSPDGALVYYASHRSADPYDHLTRVRTDGRDATVLDLGGARFLTIVSSGLLGPIAPAASGDVYVSAFPASGGGLATVIAIPNTGAPHQLPGVNAADQLTLSPDGKRLVYSVRDASRSRSSLTSYDLTNSTGTPLGHGTTKAFSHDARELLYVDDSTGEWSAVTLTSGVSRPISIRGGVSSIKLTVWPANGIRVLLDAFDSKTRTTAYSVLDLATDIETPFYTSTFEHTLSTATAWAADGATVAMWFSSCPDTSQTLFACDVPHRALYAIDVADGSDMWIAGFDDASSGPTVFSPDGRSLVYVAGTQLYVSTVP